MWGDDADQLEDTGSAQPALFALEVALFRLVESWGVRPDVLIGHSIGELAAAHVAGVLSLDDACAVVSARARLMSGLAARGGVMVAVRASEADVLPLLTDDVQIAAVNGAESVVLSGVEDAVLAVAARFENTTRLRTSHAFHSALMEPMLSEFSAAIGGITTSDAAIPVVSTLAQPGRFGDVDYWVRQVREPVRFADAVAAANADRVLEIGPDGALCALVTEIPAVPALRRDRDETDSAFRALAALYVAGAGAGAGGEVDWSALAPGGRLVDLPTYPFQHERYWPVTGQRTGDAAGLGLTAIDHPMLGAAAVSAGDGGVIVTGRLSLSTHPWLADHEAGAVAVLPGTGHLEMVLCAADQVGCDRVEELTLSVPLILPPDDALAVQVWLGAAADETGRREVRVYSRPGQLPEAEWTQHATGVVARGGALGGVRTSSLDTQTWPPEGAQAVDIDGHYDHLAANGLVYGPVFRGLRKVWRLGGAIYAEVALPEQLHGRSPGAGAFGIHPALLDAALQASWFAAANEGRNLMPFCWRGVSLHASGASTLRVRWNPTTEGGADLALSAVDAAGDPVVSVESLTVREAPRSENDRGVRDSLFEVAWTPVESLVSADAVDWALTDLARIDEIIADPMPELVLVRVDGDGPVATITGNVLALIQRWLAEERFAGSRLAFVTCGAAGPGVREAGLGASAVWGLVRTAQTEHPGRFALVDVEPDTDPAVALSALASGEEQLLVRGGIVRAARLHRLSSLVPPANGAGWRLASQSHGSLDQLGLVPDEGTDAPLPGAAVRLRVLAAGLNFRDVLNALGMYPGEPGELGAEAVGVVVEVGPEARALRVGDRVMGIAPGAMSASVVVPDERMLAAVPADWSDETAASVPLVFLTAWYAFTRLSHVGTDDRVLVHSGAGGVGMAAIQIASYLGAEVYATASEAKWGVLRGLGVPATRIASSRDTEFAKQFPEVDVVLNSLAGEFVDASLGLLREGGRFLEMGKRDVRDDPAGVDYSAFDLADAGPELIGVMLAELLELFAADVLSPLPVRSWPVGQAVDAFRFMSQAKHVGKLVIRMPQAWDPDGVVLISGGSGGLAGVLARHLVVDRGQRHVVLASRSGADPGGVAEELAAHGASVRVVACDVADADAVHELLAGLDRPVTAVVHAAGVVDDAVIDGLSPDQLTRVLSPKATGAWNLHQATLDQPLAAFVLYSSAAGVMGTAGQGNYAAANTYLDALAEYRAGCLGLPATSIAWGPWDPSLGMTAGLSETDTRRTKKAGILHIEAGPGVAMFDAAVSALDPAHIVATALSTGGSGSASGTAQVPSILRDLVRSAPAHSSPEPRARPPAAIWPRSSLRGGRPIGWPTWSRSCGPRRRPCWPTTRSTRSARARSSVIRALTR